MFENSVFSTEGFSRKVAGYEKPKSLDELKFIVKEANHKNIKIYPVSKGKNWGYGAHLPVGENNVLLDLSSLNKIVELNLDKGYAIVEPGVTQWDLYQKLQSTEFYFDVTGSGAKTSLIGNILERGIGYHFQRTDLVNGLEVLLANGELFKTGFWGQSQSDIGHLYPHGLGPGLDRLFFQSNMGIVTKASVALIRRAPFEQSFSMAFSNQHLETVIKKIATLKRLGVIFGISHLASKERFSSTAAPLLYRYLNEKRELHRFQRIMNRQFDSEWYIVGKVQGLPGVVASQRREIRKALGKISKIYFLDKSESLLKNKFVSWALGSDKKLLLEATKGLRQLNFGIPSDDGILGATWDPENPEKLDSQLNSDKVGWIFCTLLAPLNGKSGLAFRDVSEDVARDFGLVSAMTLNFLSDHILEAVISLKFKKPMEQQRAHQCIEKMMKVFRELGMEPYRININQMDYFVNQQVPFWKVAKKIKQQLDPNEIISPGRYSL